jgi:PAS domain S-box-containing protein
MPIYPNVESGDRLGACLATCDTLGRILDSVSDGIITIDRRMRVISFNRAAAAITGFTHHEAVGRFFFPIFSPMDSSMLESPFAARSRKMNM